MTYWDEKQYWADAATRNCVWLFETKSIVYPKAGCVCGARHNEDGDWISFYENENEKNNEAYYKIKKKYLGEKR